MKLTSWFLEKLPLPMCFLRGLRLEISSVYTDENLKEWRDVLPYYVKCSAAWLVGLVTWPDNWPWQVTQPFQMF